MNLKKVAEDFKGLFLSTDFYSTSNLLVSVLEKNEARIVVVFFHIINQ